MVVRGCSIFFERADFLLPKKYFKKQDAFLYRVERMDSILEKIINNRKELLVQEKKNLAPKALREMVEALDGVKEYPRFLDLYRNEVPFLIAEIKKASPSKGMIRPDFDPAAIARAYEASVHVGAVSVLTEPDFFQGSYGYLESAGHELTKPRLMKDFIVDEYQVYRGALAGASGFLLIAAALDDSEITALTAVGKSLGMTALLEVHSKEEYRRAVGAGASLIGINNRNLKTFVTDIATTAEIISSEGKQEGSLIISESGIRTFDDISALKNAGADRFLIGETFMRSTDITGEIDAVMTGVSFRE